MSRSSGFKIMKRLIGELKPLIGIMICTIIMGTLGYLVAIGIPSLGIISIMTLNNSIKFSFEFSIILMIIFAVIRGLLRYAEQLSGHYIAFRILYILRDKVFNKLRTLAPAKLEGKEKGKLISIITSDIELLEVFYAHTIAPIAIAILTNSIIVIILFFINPIFSLMAAIFFLIVGVIIPVYSSKLGREAGIKYRDIVGECNNYMLDTLRGLKEILQFKRGDERLDEINNRSKEINDNLDKIKFHEGIVRGATDLIIMIAVLSFVSVGFYLYALGEINLLSMLLAIVILASSFGPVVALSNLSNTLLQTFASAQRLFDLLDENPVVIENLNGKEVDLNDINYKEIEFSYKGRNEKIFDKASIRINKGEKISLIGESGIGKSTFVKLLMRFWDVDSGSVNFGEDNIKDIETESLRKGQTLVSQETYLFNETILDNIRIGKNNATKEEVIEAAKKASIHEFILKLPNKYETKVGELGGNLSSGEKQRIGLARAFLSGGDVLILDEPTSNLDTLNEGTILKSIKENCKDKTIVLISHRKSTTAICDKVYKLKNGKIK